MARIGEFVYPWGNGHYYRMTRLNEVLPDVLNDAELHISSGGTIYQRLRDKHSKESRVHEVRMPTPIDGSMGPSMAKSLFNVMLPYAGRQPLIRQIAGYMREERHLYDSIGFDLVINDGDMGSNVLARNRGIPSLFVTNQYMPRLAGLRSFLYPAARFVAKQIAKASLILVADSEPPHTICEYNLNFPDMLREKVRYVGHFAPRRIKDGKDTDLLGLVRDAEFGYWMRTGNESTNEGTGRRYSDVFARDEFRDERRIISHARDDSGINRVISRDGKEFGISEAYEKKTDWIQIDVGFLSEYEKEKILDSCRYAVVNGSHTVMGEVMGLHAKPVIGMPVYDEHTNHIRWAEERSLGALARTPEEVARAVRRIRDSYDEYADSLSEFAGNFDGDGARRTAGIASEMLEGNS